jgi:hypothetical protein
MSWAVQDHARACHSRQSSHSHFGAWDQTILQPIPHFSCCIAPSTALDHGVCGSVCLTCKPDCWHLWQNKLRICSFNPSITIMLGTPSHWSNNDRALCACNFFCIGYAWVHPLAVANTWVHVLPCLDLIFKNIISVYILTARCLYWSCQLLVLNRQDNVGFSMDLTPCCAVMFKVRWAVSRPMPKFLARVTASMPFCCSATCTLTMQMADFNSVESVWSHNVEDMLNNL